VTGPVRAVIFDLGGTLMWWPDWTEAAAAKWSAGHARLVAMRPGRWPEVAPFVAAMRAAELEHWAGVEGPEHTTGDPGSLVGNGFARLGLPQDDAAALAVVDGYAAAVERLVPDLRGQRRDDPRAAHRRPPPRAALEHLVGGGLA